MPSTADAIEIQSRKHALRAFSDSAVDYHTDVCPQMEDAKKERSVRVDCCYT